MSVLSGDISEGGARRRGWHACYVEIVLDRKRHPEQRQLLIHRIAQLCGDVFQCGCSFKQVRSRYTINPDFGSIICIDVRRQGVHKRRQGGCTRA